ncbi:hypothetical protein LJB87_02695, partial [Alistipes sp. OttesenSCG-928-L06]|nr:hypothetical protein [Alistipes sp. OttesenSCG-928-L06]
MSLSQKSQGQKMKRLLLTTLCFVFFGGALLAQQYNGNSNVYRYEARSLTPVNTGRSASFSIQMGNEKSFALKTNLAYWA